MRAFEVKRRMRQYFRRSIDCLHNRAQIKGGLMVAPVKILRRRQVASELLANITALLCAETSDRLRQQLSRPRVRARRDVDRPQRAVVDVLERHRDDFGIAVDIDAAEKL